MKKILPFIVIILAALGIGYNLINKEDAQTVNQNQQSNPSNVNNSDNPPQGNVSMPNQEGDIALGGQDGANIGDEDIKPAAVAYKNVTEALAAIKNGAANYDDIVLEQFTNPGEDCTYCPELYSKIKDLIADPTSKNEEKAFYAEILAISGKVENVQTLVEGLKNSTATEQKEVFAAALELVSGKEEIVRYLSKEISTDNEDLKESIVAALTNQSSALAFNTLFDEVVNSKNPDGFSAMGIGPSEMMLDEQGLVAAQQRAAKRDEFAPQAVKAMLNSGLTGLRMVMDLLATSTNMEADRRLIKDAVEHVGYDEQTEKYVQEIARSTAPLAKELAEQILQDYAQQEEAIEQEPVENEAAVQSE